MHVTLNYLLFLCLETFEFKQVYYIEKRLRNPLIDVEFQRDYSNLNNLSFYNFQAKQIDIHDLKPFYKSKIFESNHFTYDAKRKVIIHTVPEATATED